MCACSMDEASRGEVPWEVGHWKHPCYQYSCFLQVDLVSLFSKSAKRPKQYNNMQWFSECYCPYISYFIKSSGTNYYFSLLIGQIIYVHYEYIIR